MADAPLPAVLRGLGIRRGGVLMVHASLGGTGTHPRRVLAALLDVLGPDGTLVVPAFTPENSDTSRAHRRLVAGLSEREAREVRAGMPPYDPDRTGCPSMGTFAEWVRTVPGAVRSAHPQTSLAGLGPRAAELLADHDPHCHLGEGSPLARLYDADAQILLLRVGFEVCSAFHLAEYRLDPPPPRRVYRCVVGERGNWISYEDLALHDGDFAAIGARLRTGPRAGPRAGPKWEGRPVTVLGMRAAVDGARRELASVRHGLA